MAVNSPVIGQTRRIFRNIRPGRAGGGDWTLSIWAGPDSQRGALPNRINCEWPLVRRLLLTRGQAIPVSRYGGQVNSV